MPPGGRLSYKAWCGLGHHRKTSSASLSSYLNISISVNRYADSGKWKPGFSSAAPSGSSLVSEDLVIQEVQQALSTVGITVTPSPVSTQVRMKISARDCFSPPTEHLATLHWAADFTDIKNTIPGEMEAYILTKTHTQVFTAALLIINPN